MRWVSSSCRTPPGAGLPLPPPGACSATQASQAHWTRWQISHNCEDNDDPRALSRDLT